MSGALAFPLTVAALQARIADPARLRADRPAPREDAEHPIRVHLDPVSREPRPYILVRPGLEARINRAVFYELVALAQAEVIDGRKVLGVWSEGIFFPIDEAPILDAPEA